MKNLIDEKSDWFTRVVMTVVASLCTAGVVGLVAMSSQLSRVEERVVGLDGRVSGLLKVNTDRLDYAAGRIDQIAKDQREADRRVGIIEGRLR